MYVIGDYVKVKGQNIEGYIIKMTKQYATLLSKDKYVKANINNIEPCAINEKSEEKFSVKVNISSPAIDEIMLRHQTVDEALEHLEKFIDNAICHNVKIIKIIHGKNGGILRKEVHKYLLNNPYVKEHRLGGYYEGSYGVTIAFLK